VSSLPIFYEQLYAFHYFSLLTVCICNCFCRKEISAKASRKMLLKLTPIEENNLKILKVVVDKNE
jgi:hypothetical protein